MRRDMSCKLIGQGWNRAYSLKMSPSMAQTRKPRRFADAVTDRPSRLLAWYDRHRRELPWRARAGVRADPYRVWLSEIMLQQTTVRAVGPYFEKFATRWPDVESLARAPREDVMRLWAGLGYYARARNLHACAVAVVRDHGGEFPDTEQGLRRLPGIGPYTAAAIAAIAFGRRTMPVDGNIERVTSRLFAVEETLPQAKPRIKRAAETLLAPSRAGDSVQALMDLGATICTPKRPACARCPLMEDCAAAAQGAQETFPRKTARKTGALRRGAAFVVCRGDELLLRARPAVGLLGGMSEVPGTDWREEDDHTALKQAPALCGIGRWHRTTGVVTHTFTHFPLQLVVYTAKVPARTKAPAGMRWVPIAGLAEEALPKLMRKVIAHALDGRLRNPR